MTDYQIRPIRASEWRAIRELRLTALQDEVAGIAFLDTYDEALVRPDEFWQQRAHGSSVDNPEPASRQWVAITEAGEWVGTTVALIERPGERGAIGAITASGGHLVGVYIHPDHRGNGLLGRLFETASTWLAEQGMTRIRLFVHTDNARAQAAYRRLGFETTGVSTATTAGEELEMVLRS
ncbi:GNAT family N-acetyltransferase [Nocardioides insulae]|uniref:GNAT family N-acetyltransferase n=1 Tax=Nocardioides insulae TaxID=394734 RepID=UPI00041E6417|nr:GNAT family N-acetyltransferase [Nocardioides insulae]